MSTIDEAVEFFTEFFKAECKVIDANYSGAASFEKLHAEMQSMLSNPSVFQIHKQDLSNLKGIAKASMENTKKVIAPRQIFLVEEHDVGKRKLFCAYVSVPRKPAAKSSYEEKFWADDALRVVALYFGCPECDAVGEINGAKCRQCGGRGWRHHGGGESITAGKPRAVKKLLRPTFPQHAAHYDQL
jgi:hypothetical protein